MNLRVIAEILGILVILSSTMVWYHNFDNEGLEDAIAEMSLDVLKPKLAGLYRTQCVKEKRGEEMPDFLWQQIQSGQDRHKRLAGREYKPRECR